MSIPRICVSLALLPVVVTVGSATGIDEVRLGYNFDVQTGAYDCSGIPRWEQTPDGVSLLASQDDTCYPFVAESADDFVAADNFMHAVGWWGGYWSGSPVPPEGFRINIYTQGAGNFPGELVYSETVTEYHESMEGTDASYCAELSGQFTGAVGQTYYIVIQALLCFPPQWGIGSSGDGNGTIACFRGELFGYPDWVPWSEVSAPYEQAFVLFDFHGTPVDVTSWSRLKGQYR